MEDHDAVTPENRGAGPYGLVRPYVAGQGRPAGRPLDATAAGDGAGDGADDEEGWFVAPPGPVAGLGRPLASFGDRAEPTSGYPAHLLAGRPAAARPGRPARGPRPKSAGFIPRRRSLALAAAGGLAVAAGMVFLALPGHPAGNPVTGCKAPGCHAPSAAPASSRPQMSLYARAGSTMSASASAPASHPATSRAASPAPSDAVRRTATAPSPSPSPSSGSPGLSPGSLISIEATTPCCTAFSIAHDVSDSGVMITQVTPGSSLTARAGASWTVRKGLADSSCVSFESADAPGYYLWHQDFVLFLASDDGSAGFAARATFCPQAGNSGEGYSFQAFDRPGTFIRQFDGIVYLASDGGALPWDTTALWHHDTTWQVIRPWA
jgi:hypothetical protein